MTQEEDGTYTTSSYDPITQESEILVQGNQYKSICSGRGLYYKQVVDRKKTFLYSEWQGYPLRLLYLTDINQNKRAKRSTDVGNNSEI